MTTPTRLPAAERRQALIETAIQVFAAGSYRGTTTAEIARAAGISEPILYRHFGSKRELYLAALDYVWSQVRSAWEQSIAAEPDAGRWVGACAHAYISIANDRLHLAELWIQALTEAGEDPALRRHLRRHMREVHRFVADVIRRAQEAGGVLPARDADAEAWLFLAGGVLGTVGRRIGLLVEDDLGRIKASRVEWMTGASPTKSA